MAGKSGLIHAATGVGKTYAAWFGALMEWMADSSPISGMLPQKVSPHLSVLWVTPLQALATDLQAALLQVESIVPRQMERFPWAGHLGLKLLPQVLEKIRSAGSTLVFTNTRSQAELWFHAILEACPDWIGRFGLHHGSLNRSERDRAEQGLRNGRLKGVVCTSSLDLGVDFTPVDLVLQIGSPKGIARR